MPRLLNYLAPLYIWLHALDPALPQALFVSLVFFTVWLIRKLAPNQWEVFANLIHVKSDDTAWWQNELRALWQMLPAAIIGTIYGVLGTGAELVPTLRLTVLSLLAPVVHRIAQRYKGEVGTSKNPAPIALLLLVVACALPLSACSKVNWPKVLQCAGELQQPVLDSVTKVLHGTGDVESELADVARRHGAGVVECAVQQVIDDLTSKPSASIAEARAVHRGREFLAAVQR